MSPRVLDSLFYVGLAGVCFGHLALVVRPLMRESKAAQDQLEVTQRDIANGLRFTEGLEDVRLYIGKFEDSLAELDELVPRKFNADQRIQQVSTVITECGLRDDSLRPDPSLPRGEVMAHPLTVKVFGRYDQLIAFLNRAEELPQFTRVTKLLVTREQDSMVSAEVELTSFSAGGDL